MRLRTCWPLVGATLVGVAACGLPPAATAPPPPGAASVTTAAPPPVPSAPTPNPAPPQEAATNRDAIRAAVAAADRDATDREMDAGRQPALMLEFFGIAPGMHVAELGAGGGYTSELLARVVGPEGKVYAQNNAFVLKRFAEGPLSERLTKPLLSNVVRVDREFDDPLPPEAKELDAILIVLFYHDTVWQKTDRDRMNTALFAALRPGGVLGIVDHSAAQGAGVSVTESLHRIEESSLIEEVERAGFVLKDSADFLRNPEDTRDWNAAPRAAGERRGTSDRFVLRFEKPAG